MAPMALQPPQHPLKRSASQTDFDTPKAKKQIIGQTKHHYAKWDLQAEYRKDGRWQDSERVEDLLNRSISLALEAVGFESADSATLQSFRFDVEQYISHFLTSARQQMIAARRTRPVAEDFLQALHEHGLSLRALLPHLDPPVSPSKSQFSLQIADPNPEEESSYRPLTSLFASSNASQSYIPKHFPLLPDRHTYQSTPDYPQRDFDPKTLREKANEQAREGERALRTLVAAERQSALKRAEEQRLAAKRPPSLREQREKMWLETMASVAQDEGISGDAMEVDSGNAKADWLDELSLGVNADKQYWRKAAR